MAGTKRSIAYLEDKFQTGDVPTQQDFYDWLASFAHLDTRVQSVTSSATVTPNAATDDMVKITAQAEALDIANPTGTPSEGQGLIIRVKDDGTARAITYGSEYRGTIPATTVIGETLYLVFIYNATDSKWDYFEDESGSGGHTIEDEGTPLTARTKLNFVGAGVAVTDDSGDDATVVTISGGGSAEYWTTLPGTPVRSSNTVLTITDTANANLYNFKFGRGTVLKWTDTTTHMAMVHSATYAADTVTITIIGDVLSGTATMNTFEYALEKAEKVTFAIAGTLATGTDLARKWKADKPYRIFGADGLHGTAGTTNPTTYDIKKNGTTFMTTKLSIASAATVGNGYTADDNTSFALDDVATLDCDSVSTTAPVDVYVDLFMFPTYNQYL